jgi:hypothetical protein
MTFGGIHWSSAVAMLSAVENTKRENTLELFKIFSQKAYG